MFMLVYITIPFQSTITYFYFRSIAETRDISVFLYAFINEPFNYLHPHKTTMCFHCRCEPCFITTVVYAYLMHDASVKTSKMAWQFFNIDTAEVQKAHRVDKYQMIVTYGPLENGWERTWITHCIIGQIKATLPDPYGEYVHLNANSNNPGLPVKHVF
jgi:hypothetical protein